LAVKEIEDGLRKIIGKFGKDTAKISKELGITEINSKYLINKYSQ